MESFKVCGRTDYALRMTSSSDLFEGRESRHPITRMTVKEEANSSGFVL
jgi:hypothetical protein